MNKTAIKEGLFKRALSAINPAPSMKRAVEAQKGMLTKQIDSLESMRAGAASLSDASLNSKEANKIRKTMKGFHTKNTIGTEEYNKDLLNYSNKLKGKIDNKKSALDVINGAEGVTEADLIAAGKGIGVAGYANIYKNAIGDYYTSGSTKQKLLKAGVTGGAVGGAMLGTRYATGGNLTTNGKGESDIIGVPFV